ncbi:hypothetical protein MFIFM68171_05795 [Madurella fahalii]|uniref:Uncharacterized protein n=1 Tax=Madurella fahalii TaxID=1157608 RepID=A0ABQ0GDG7_9PEZI
MPEQSNCVPPIHWLLRAAQHTIPVSSDSIESCIALLSELSLSESYDTPSNDPSSPAGLPVEITLASLPVEIRAQILSNLESLVDLVSAILATPLFKAAYDESYISVFQGIARHMFGPRGLDMAVAVIRIRQHKGCARCANGQLSAQDCDATPLHILRAYIDRSLKPMSMEEPYNVFSLISNAVFLASQYNTTVRSNASEDGVHCASSADHDCFQAHLGRGLDHAKVWMARHILQMELYLCATAVGLGAAVIQSGGDDDDNNGGGDNVRDDVTMFWYPEVHVTLMLFCIRTWSIGPYLQRDPRVRQRPSLWKWERLRAYIKEAFVPPVEVAKKMMIAAGYSLAQDEKTADAGSSPQSNTVQGGGSGAQAGGALGAQGSEGGNQDGQVEEKRVTWPKTPRGRPVDELLRWIGQGGLVAAMEAHGCSFFCYVMFRAVDDMAHCDAYWWRAYRNNALAGAAN